MCIGGQQLLEDPMQVYASNTVVAAPTASDEGGYGVNRSDTATECGSLAFSFSPLSAAFLLLFFIGFSLRLDIALVQGMERVQYKRTS